jgi:hypothetical protein
MPDRHSTSYALERHVEPLILPNQISGLSNPHHDLKLANLVTTLGVQFITLRARYPALVSASCRRLDRHSGHFIASLREGPRS